MIGIDQGEVVGWWHAIIGARNPMNSWNKIDSSEGCEKGFCKSCEEYRECIHWCQYMKIGPNDYDLMKRLCKAGTDHRKFMRMITVYTHIEAPLYWWKEFDTYKVGTVANSCSTMHKIHAKEFTMKDFSHEHLMASGLRSLAGTIKDLNEYREAYVNYDTWDNNGLPKPPKKDIWWQMIQLLPSSYNQRRSVMLNYEVLSNIYHARKNHKLDEWHEFCDWIETLPYSELITGDFEKKGEEN